MSQDSIVRLQCTVCKSFNYHTHRNLRPQDGKKLALNKFCRKCRRHQPHKEKAKK